MNSRVVHKAYQWYYQKAVLVFARHQGRVYVTMQIPLTSFATKFRAFHLQVLPITLLKEPNHIMMIDGLPVAWSISDDLQFYYEMTEKEISHIEDGVPLEEKFIVKRVRDENCIVSLYRDECHSIKRYCRYNILTTTRREQVIPISLQVYLLVNVEKYEIRCEGKNASIEHKGCTNCVQAIEVFCDYTDNNWYVAPSLKMLWLDWKEGNSFEYQKHLINIPFLNFFFKNNTAIPRPIKRSR